MRGLPVARSILAPRARKALAVCRAPFPVSRDFARRHVCYLEKEFPTMRSVKTSALLGAASLCLALTLPVAAFASPANPQHSSPAEKAATNDLNEGINDANQAADDRYQAQQETYQNELQRYRGRNQNYQEKAARYEAARDRYIAGHAGYHRAAWPSRYESWEISGTGGLMGARVQTATGRTLGHVAEIALTPTGRIDALRVSLDRRRRCLDRIRRSAVRFR